MSIISQDDRKYCFNFNYIYCSVYMLLKKCTLHNKKYFVASVSNVSCHFVTALTHWDRVTHICVCKLTIIGSDNSLSSWTAPSHYQNQCWIIVNWTLTKELQWNFNRNSNILIQENAFESVVCEVASILSRPQCVNARQETYQWWWGSLASPGINELIFVEPVSVIHYNRLMGHCLSYGWKDLNSRCNLCQEIITVMPWWTR